MKTCLCVSGMHRVVWMLAVTGTIMLGHAGRAAAVCLGDMKADKILFLGNSITLHGPYVGWSLDGHWGMGGQ